MQNFYIHCRIIKTLLQKWEYNYYTQAGAHRMLHIFTNSIEHYIFYFRVEQFNTWFQESSMTLGMRPLKRPQTSWTVYADKKKTKQKTKQNRKNKKQLSSHLDINPKQSFSRIKNCILHLCNPLIFLFDNSIYIVTDSFT